jgi:hypothetical protein
VRIHDEHFMVLPPFHNCRYQSILDMYMDVLYIIYIDIHDVNIIHLYRYRTRFLEFPRYLDLYVYIYIFRFNSCKTSHFRSDPLAVRHVPVSTGGSAADVLPTWPSHELRQGGAQKPRLCSAVLGCARHGAMGCDGALG